MDEPFKLTEEISKQIEEKVNKGLADVNNGMKERLISSGCYNRVSFFTACWVAINIEDSKVTVIDPVSTGSGVVTGSGRCNSQGISLVI